MEGIQVTTDGARTVVHIEHFSQELAESLRQHLAGYCFGTELAEDPDYYSFKKTVTELLARYDRKDKKGKIGLAGELITHVVMAESHPEFVPSSPFFNKEERAVRKGFDSTFIVVREGEDAPTLWYGEVKSSGSAKGSSAALAGALLDAAAADLNTKLSGEYRRALWDSAIVDAKITLDSATYESASELLRSHSTLASDGQAFEKRIIATAGIFRATDTDHVDIAELAGHEGKYTAPYGFAEVALLVIRQETVDAMVDFLRVEAASDES